MFRFVCLFFVVLGVAYGQAPLRCVVVVVFGKSAKNIRSNNSTTYAVMEYNTCEQRRINQKLISNYHLQMDKNRHSMIGWERRGQTERESVAAIIIFFFCLVNGTG